jgi:hypothetical protein
MAVNDLHFAVVVGINRYSVIRVQIRHDEPNGYETGWSTPKGAGAQGNVHLLVVPLRRHKQQWWAIDGWPREERACELTRPRPYDSIPYVIRSGWGTAPYILDVSTCCSLSGMIVDPA